MGLDIIAVSKLVLVSTVDPREEGYDLDKFVWVRPNDACFDDRSDGLETGLFEFGKKTSFRAGSYSGYNEWRAMLCKAALGVQPQVVWDAPNDFSSRPFFELIHFSDCEGVIGPKTSSWLFKDFAEHSAEIGAKLAAYDGYSRDYFLEKYDSWAKAFALASDGGAVLFC